ncbi:MAG: hypothetical protein VKI63_01715 [Cyanobium sp.]|nr:hypothetical protein [Cyanobium sp.]
MKPPPPDAGARRQHAVVIPLFGPWESDFPAHLRALTQHGLVVILVDNNPLPIPAHAMPCRSEQIATIPNRNRGGIAGGLNAGIRLAYSMGARWITLLDMDSRIAAVDVERLKEPLVQEPLASLVIGPSIRDVGRKTTGDDASDQLPPLEETRVLISSGTTFRGSDWQKLGALNEELFIDFVDHAWCFRAHARGFRLLRNNHIVLEQRFGSEHPNRLCRLSGMQLYSPERHYFSLRNLRWLCLQPYAPLDIKLKESLKMLIKPWLWLAFEPNRRMNLRAIVKGLLAPLPNRYS